MADKPLTKFAGGAGPLLAIGLILLASLVLMSNATQDSARFGEMFSLLLVVNALGLLLLIGLIGWNLLRLKRQVRRQRAGARLTARMVVMFVVLAVTPVLVVYYFSLQFLHRGIDSWFDVRVERALDDALELSRTALSVRMRELLKQTELVAGDLIGVADEAAAITLEDARRLGGASEITLIGAKGRIIATSSTDPTAIIPPRPNDTILMQLLQSGNYIGLDPIGDSGLHVRVVVSVPEDVPGSEPRVLQALFPVAERMNILADSVQSAYAKYRELAYLRKPLKVSFTLTLSLVLLISLLTAVWAAFLSARRMVAPLRDLAEGTQAVAEGDYETRLARTSTDEVGFLVESFNDMTHRLRRARDETRASQHQVEEQRAYLEAVLSRLSTGVMAFDASARLVTANQAGARILDVDLDAVIGKTVAEIGAEHARLHPLTDGLSAHLNASSSGRDWRAEIMLFGPAGRQTLMCSAAPLHGSAGHVVVFDDVTELIQAQRNAAWSEVARRLAHEIKNPLTPIQLSAERLRHKCLGRMPPAEDEVLDRLTRTIVQQVESMKEMVNAFSDYARTPSMQPRLLDLNTLLTDVLELYRGDESAHEIETHLEQDLPALEADPDRLRQLLHNLIKNALEADSNGAPTRIVITTSHTGRAADDSIELRIRDQGPGFPADILQRLFEPYVTTKPKGTGLGLAIVKKIVEEHGGTVAARNHPGGGASVSVRLPAVSEPAARPLGETRERAG